MTGKPWTLDQCRAYWARYEDPDDMRMSAALTLLVLCQHHRGEMFAVLDNREQEGVTYHVPSLARSCVELLPSEMVDDAFELPEVAHG